MKSAGYAVYDALANRLEVIRPGESIKRQIPCLNIRPFTSSEHSRHSGRLFSGEWASSGVVI